MSCVGRWGFLGAQKYCAPLSRCFRFCEFEAFFFNSGWRPWTGEKLAVSVLGKSLKMISFGKSLPFCPCWRSPPSELNIGARKKPFKKKRGGNGLPSEGKRNFSRRIPFERRNRIQRVVPYEGRIKIRQSFPRWARDCCCDVLQQKGHAPDVLYRFPLVNVGAGCFFLYQPRGLRGSGAPLSAFHPQGGRMHKLNQSCKSFNPPVPRSQAPPSGPERILETPHIVQGS